MRVGALQLFGSPFWWPADLRAAQPTDSERALAEFHGGGLSDAKLERIACVRTESLLNPLEKELGDYAQRLRLKALWMLEAQGVERDLLMAIASAGDFGLCSVNATRGLWEPDGASPRLIMAVRDEDGFLIDMIALQSADRNSWALRTGDGWVLGADRFAMVRAEGAGPLPIYGSPIAWLCGQTDGICILEWNRSSIARLRNLGPGVTLMAEDQKAAEALGEALRWNDLPGIEVADQMRRVA